MGHVCVAAGAVTCDSDKPKPTGMAPQNEISEQHNGPPLTIFIEKEKKTKFFHYF